MEVVFWICLAGLLWAYVGYPLGMLARAAVRRQDPPRESDGVLPSVSVILAVRNAATELSDRVANLLEQDYPAELLEVVIACNGCTDDTEALADELAALHPRVRRISTPGEQGKAGALNAGAAAAEGDILVFADARQRFDSSSVTRLVDALADPQVGGVTGRLVIGQAAAPVVAGVGSYWQLETGLRLAESRTGSVVGATGAIYAVKKALFRPLPHGVILDDVYLPMDIVRRGYRIGMAPDAVAWDRPSSDYAGEYRRRVRTLVGNYELLRLMPHLLSPVHNPIFVRYVSHKLLRVLTPLLCLGVVLAGVLANGIAYNAVAVAVLMVYALGVLGLLLPIRALAIPSAFLLLHTAGVSAMLRPRRGAADLWA